MQALRAYRKAKKLSQKAAAESVGVFRETWARWESGAHKIGADHLPVVAEKTGIPKRVLRPDIVELLREPA